MTGAMVQGDGSFYVLGAARVGGEDRALASRRRCIPAPDALVRITPDPAGVVEGLVASGERGRRAAMTTVRVLRRGRRAAGDGVGVASDPRNLPQWDTHIVRSVSPPQGRHAAGATVRVVMAFMGVQTPRCAPTVLEWEPPWRSRVRLDGLLDATVTTSVARCRSNGACCDTRWTYRFRGPLGGFARRGPERDGWGADARCATGCSPRSAQIEAAPARESRERAARSSGARRWPPLPRRSATWPLRRDRARRRRRALRGGETRTRAGPPIACSRA